MLTRNLVAALSCASFSLMLSQSAAATTLTPDELGEMPDVAVEQQRGPATMLSPKNSAGAPPAGEKSVQQIQVEAPMTPAPAAPGPQESAQIQPQSQPETSVEDRRAFYEQRYQDLRARAKDAGVDMSAQPPWAGRGMGRQFMTDEERAAHREAMRSMPPEERQNYRRKMHEQMRERAWEEGVVLPDTPPWDSADEQRRQAPPWARAGEQRQAPPPRPAWVDKMAEYRDRVSRMSPEDRAACQALTRMEMRDRMLQMQREMSARMQRMQEYMPRQFSPGAYGQGYPHAPEGDFGYDYPMAPGSGYGAGYPSPWDTPGPGYGSGPAAPFDDVGSGYPGAPGPGYGTGYGPPWGYDR